MNSRYFFFHQFRFVYAYTYSSSFLNWNSNEKKKINIERIFFQTNTVFSQKWSFSKTMTLDISSFHLKAAAVNISITKQHYSPCKLKAPFPSTPKIQGP